MKHIRLLIVSTLGILVLVAGLTLASAPAQAASVDFRSWVSSNTGGANLRSCPSTGCSSLGYMRNGAAIHMICWTDAQNAYGNYWSPRWFKVYTLSLGASGGWVHSSLVANQTAVPHC